MDENEVIENQLDDETIEEVDETTDDPDLDEEIDDEEDKSEDDDTIDPTSSDDEEDENFLGTFKTKEDADKGFKDAQAKITTQANEIKELKKQLNMQDTNSLPDVDREIQAVHQKVNHDYAQRLQGLGYKYSSYIPNDAVINTIDDIVANLPPQQASQFTAELLNIQNTCNARLQNEINNVKTNATAKFDEIKAKDKERYKDDMTVFNAWYDPPETIEGVAELVANVRKQAIEDYIREQAAKQEDDAHKKKLVTNANSKAKFKDDHIFTRAEIAKMSDREFAKYEAKISEQVAAGLVE